MHTDLTLEKIIEKYGQMVPAVARRMVQDEFLAKDIAQEIWIEGMQSLDSFRGDSKFSTWLYTIAYSLLWESGKRSDSELPNQYRYFRFCRRFLVV